MQFSDDAGLFSYEIDLAADRVLLVRLTEDDYRRASFLDARIMAQHRQARWENWSTLDDASQNLPGDARWIFHIGHVGSTLISRLLGESKTALSVREPQILRQFAELKQSDGLAHSPWPRGQHLSRLETAIRMLSRSFADQQKAVVKASSFASDLASDILTSQGRKAVFLYVGAERYLPTILAGENSRKELAMLAGPRLQRLNRRLAPDELRLWELSEAQRAAMCWVCEMSALDAATSDQVLWVDFDTFLNQPDESLARIAKHLEVTLDQRAIEALVNGPIMNQYSKAPEHGYSTQLREDVLAQAVRDHGTAITAALSWLDTVGQQFPLVGSALDRAERHRHV